MGNSENEEKKGNKEDNETKKDDEFIKREKKIDEEPEATELEDNKHDIGDLSRLSKIGHNIVRKLEEAGITTIRGLAMTPITRLLEIDGIGEKTAFKIARFAYNRIKETFATAEKVHEFRGTLLKCTTGSDELNELLGGGIQMETLYEFYGKSASGKTQISHQLCVNSLLPIEEGGFNGNSLYVDTERTFRTERIEQMCKPLNLSFEEAKKRIFRLKVYNSDHQMLMTRYEIPKYIEEKDIKLVVFDSLTAHFRAEFTGRRVKIQRQQALNMHIHDLLRIIDLYEHIAIVITNQVSSITDTLGKELTVSVGGNIVAHSSINRICLRHENGYILDNEKKKIMAEIIKSPYIENGTRKYFYITKGGIQDENGVISKKIDKDKQKFEQD